jgi:hypothetical protein
MRDMFAKGRASRPSGEAWRRAHPPESLKGPNSPNPVRGSANHFAKLDERTVSLIKRALVQAGGERGSGSRIAAEYGTSKYNVSLIKSGVTWRHVEPAVAP